MQKFLVFLFLSSLATNAQQLKSLKILKTKHDSIETSLRLKYQENIKGKLDKEISEIYYNDLKSRNSNNRDRYKNYNAAVRDLLNTQKLAEATNLPENKSALQKTPVYSLGFPELYKEVHDFIAKSYKNLDYPLSLTTKIHFIVQNDSSLYIEKVEGNDAEFNDLALLAFLMVKGKWEAGEQFGRPVKTKFILPVKYTVEE